MNNFLDIKSYTNLFLSKLEESFISDIARIKKDHDIVLSQIPYNEFCKNVLANAKEFITTDKFITFYNNRLQAAKDQHIVFKEILEHTNMLDELVNELYDEFDNYIEQYVYSISVIKCLNYEYVLESEEA